MAVRMQMELDDKELRRQFAEMIRKGKDTRPVLKRIGAWMAFRATDAQWKSKGRRYQAGGWPERSPMTIGILRWRGVSEATAESKILEVTGTLRKQWEYRVRGRGEEAYVEAGTAIKYADIHHEGKTVPAPKRWKYRSQVDIPQRILIAIGPEDMKKAREFADRYLAGPDGIVKGATR